MYWASGITVAQGSKSLTVFICIQKAFPFGVQKTLLGCLTTTTTTTTISRNNLFNEQNNSSAHLHMSHYFFVTFLWRHDYDVNPPNKAFYGGLARRTWTYDNEFSFLFLKLDRLLKNSSPEEIASIWQIERVQLFSHPQITFKLTEARGERLYLQYKVQLWDGLNNNTINRIN